MDEEKELKEIKSKNVTENINDESLKMTENLEKEQINKFYENIYAMADEIQREMEHCNLMVLDKTVETKWHLEDLKTFKEFFELATELRLARNDIKDLESKLKNKQPHECDCPLHKSEQLEEKRYQQFKYFKYSIKCGELIFNILSIKQKIENLLEFKNQLDDPNGVKMIFSCEPAEYA